MAPSSFSLLLRHFSKTPKFHHRILSPLLKHHFSSNTPTSSSKPPSSSLSARLSFVFDKIDEIEKERSKKDEALQRIRAWRESKKPNQQQPPDINDTKDQNPGLGFSESAAIIDDNNQLKENRKKREIELAHPWPEWIELMERLAHQNYFDHRRKDEDKMIEGLGGSIDGDVEDEDDLGFDFTRDWKTVHAAILNFGKDRFDIFRSLSRQDIQLLVGYGCPSADKKVVFSSKLLRKHVHLDEGDVCSSCSLRNSCERAYLVTNKEDEARTIDVMRVLLTYGFDAINGSVENKSLLKQKSVKSAVRKLLNEIVRLSVVPLDPNLPPPVIKQRPPKVKQPPPPPKRRVGRDDIEMKKGDWLCPKCNFMNFAKNVVCLQCDAKRPKRQLLPGEWECPQCNFLNYRRNMACFNCEHKRPPDEYMENQMQGRQHRPVTRPGRVVNREELPNAWNFDFDDDESDGADVAAFEYADAHAMNEDQLLDNQPENGNFSKVPDEELYRVSRSSRSQEKEHSRLLQMRHGTGFDDFDDEDDDLDSYELNNHNRSKEQETSPVQFSDLEGYSETEAEDDMPGYSRSRSHSYAKTSRSSRNKGALSDSVDNDLDFDSDEDLPVHPKWKSSHVADSGRRHRGSRGPSNRIGFGSDEDERLVFGSDDDLEEDFGSRQGRGNIRNPEHRSFRRGDDSNQNRKQSGFRGRQDVNFVQGDNFDDEFGRPSQGYRSNKSGSFDNKHRGHRMNGRERGTNASKQQGSGNIGRRRFDESDDWSDVDNDRPIRQRINVR